MDGDAHQEKHTHISCGLIFLFASSRGAGRFIWKDGNEGGEALVRLQFLFSICYSPFFLFLTLSCSLYFCLFFLKGRVLWDNKPVAWDQMGETEFLCVIFFCWDISNVFIIRYIFITHTHLLIYNSILFETIVFFIPKWDFMVLFLLLSFCSALQEWNNSLQWKKKSLSSFMTEAQGNRLTLLGLDL